MCGDQKVLMQDVGGLIQDLGGWYHLMVTRLLYTNPTVKALDLHYHAKVTTVLFTYFCRMVIMHLFGPFDI